jgi:hypothetical protein
VETVTTLADFLLARIAEDQAAARKCVGPEWDTGLPATIHPNPTTYRTVVRQVGHVCGSIIAADAEHIARWDPARVLAECDAKRRIVELVQGPLTEIAQTAIGCCETTDPGDTEVGDKILRALALPYADHENYRPEWKPT